MLKLTDAINGDYRKEEIKEFIQEKLKKIPALSKYEDDIPFDVLEIVLWKIFKKYDIVMQYIMPGIQVEGPSYYSCSFKAKENNAWIGSVYGRTIYELFAKGVLMCYSYAKKHNENIH